MKSYIINFKKTVWGFFRVEANTEEEAREKALDGDFIDEFDNESDYEFDTEKGKTDSLDEAKIIFDYEIEKKE